MDTWVLHLEVIHDVGKHGPAKQEFQFFFKCTKHKPLHRRRFTGWRNIPVPELTTAGGTPLPRSRPRPPTPSKKWSVCSWWRRLESWRVRPTGEKQEGLWWFSNSRTGCFAATALTQQLTVMPKYTAFFFPNRVRNHCQKGMVRVPDSCKRCGKKNQLNMCGRRSINDTSVAAIHL